MLCPSFTRTQHNRFGIRHLLAQNVRENQWGHDTGVRINDVAWCVFIEFVPSDFLVGYRSRIRSVRCGRVRNLREILPVPHVPLQVLDN